ncbi:MAG: flagellin [Candidatus Bathyarchaeota archaeon]|nr:flagellin [Candidatus Bathyarchaeota archaeon]MDH5747378.1 flagellin [Candidatus Bathyarchaeota archaeon]
MKKLFKDKRGIVGIEAAIVLIAFIIIAAALSYVVINMGFYTTQKTKETMQSGLDESLSALQLDGIVTAKTNNNSYIEWIVFPVKLSAGKSAFDLKKEALVVSIYLPNATLLSIYNGIYSNDTDEADLDVLIGGLSETYAMNETDMAAFVMYNCDSDSVLESSEKAFLIIHLNETVTATGARHAVADYETVKIEVKGAKGAALTVVRTAPGGIPKNSHIDLG